MRVLAFRHGLSEHLGSIADALDLRGFDWEYVDLYQSPQTALSPGDRDALVFLGGAISANDDLPYLRRELEIISEAFERGTPVLGVCLGAQLIAKALGAGVYPNATKEIGWAPVTFTEAARLDPLFAGLSGPETVFHWHGDTFELPARAELLASSAACRNQAFRAGDRIYGLQFHLEVTPAMIAQWCEEDVKCGEMREAREPIDPQAHGARAGELARLVFGRWCELVKRGLAACAR